MAWAEQYFDALKNETHCNTVTCLVNLTSTQLSTAALTATTAAYSSGPAYPYGLPYAPVIDGVDVVGEPHILARKGPVVSPSSPPSPPLMHM